MQAALDANLARIVRLNCIFECGSSNDGLPVVMIVGARIPGNSDVPVLEELFLLFLATIERASRMREDGRYCVVYTNTATTPANRPQFEWIKMKYGAIPRRLRKSLSKVLLFQPNFALKGLTFFTKNFVSDKVWSKVVSPIHLRCVELTRALGQL